MFCPPLSTPPAAASGDAWSLISAILFGMAPRKRDAGKKQSAFRRGEYSRVAQARYEIVFSARNNRTSRSSNFFEALVAATTASVSRATVIESARSTAG